MRILVCGSRDFNDADLLVQILDGYEIDTIIEGEARGADKLSAVYAGYRGIPVERYPADWDLHGRAAGPIRNARMLTEGKPDCVVAFWDGKSRGTQNMINQAEKAGVKVVVVDV